MLRAGLLSVVLAGTLFAENDCNCNCNCNYNYNQQQAQSQANNKSVGTKKHVVVDTHISREEIDKAQKIWGDAIVEIGKAYTEGKDYKALAKKHVKKLYGYSRGLHVLFKPTKAAKQQFRLTEEEAISYFVTGLVPEDHGFALQPWSKVRFENAGEIFHEDSAVAMGNYYFTDAKTGNEVKVEYTFEYVKDEDGNLVIEVHYSGLPYH
jgi:hypothetical protein